MKRRTTLTALLSTGLLALPAAAQEQEQPPKRRGLTLDPGTARVTAPGGVAPTQTTPSDGDDERPAAAADSTPTDERRGLGLEPGAPNAGALPGGASPGVRSTSADDWRFDFHGMFTMPLRAGIGKRANPTADQSDTVFHAPPVVPGEVGSFADTNVLARPWVQLNFSYGTSTVTGTVVIAAKTASSAAGFFDPPKQTGITDAFLTFDLPMTDNAKLAWYVGAFTNRYGIMGEFDEGQYATPLMARVEGVGTTLAGRFKLNPEVDLTAEYGLNGSFDKPVLGTVPEGWNEFADPNVGSTYATHVHLGASFSEFAHVSGHYLLSWSQDDQANVQVQPDAMLAILGGDVRLTMGPWGHLYLGASHADADHVRSLGGVVRYLNTADGPDLMRNYLGVNSDGNGKITSIGLQYDFSLASAMLHPEPFSGNAPDLRWSLFGMLTSVSSDDDGRPPADPANRFGICSEACRKLGTEVSYSFLPWMAGSLRFDNVAQDVDDGDESFSILSPRVIFRSDYNSQDQVTLQYSRYLYGNQVFARDPAYDPTDLTYDFTPDENVVSITGTMWW